jgi:Protein of unknown function (DUF4232)
MKKGMTTAAIACAAALAAAATSAALASQAASAGTARAAAPATRAAIPRCTVGSLSAGLHGAQAGLANRGMILTLTNTGNRSCTLDGYPGLGLEDSSHNAVPSHTHWGGTYFDQDPGPAVIVLSPGETASADLAYVVGAGTSSDSVATYLQVTPPNAFSHLTVPIPGAPERIDHGNLFVTAMARHTAY